MDQHKWWQVTWLFISIIMFLSSLVQTLQTYDRESLEDFFCKQVNKGIENPKTGIFYNTSLPSNYTGMKVRAVRMRTSSFYIRGLNYSLFNVPPRVVPQPNRKRMVILYENFGNWSSHYFNVPTKYTMVAPVFGFVAYTSSKNAFIENEKMSLVIQGKPILIHFHHVRLHGKNDTPICVKFLEDGSLKFKNMSRPYVCEVFGTGHYTLVIPSSSSLFNKSLFNIWWILGFVIGFVGLVLLVLVLVTLVKASKKRKIKKFEKNSENGEAFDTFWIGETKMPLGSMIRTQPVLIENDS